MMSDSSYVEINTQFIVPMYVQGGPHMTNKYPTFLKNEYKLQIIKAMRKKWGVPGVIRDGTFITSIKIPTQNILLHFYLSKNEDAIFPSEYKVSSDIVRGIISTVTNWREMILQVQVIINNMWNKRLLITGAITVGLPLAGYGIYKLEHDDTFLAKVLDAKQQIEGVSPGNEEKTEHYKKAQARILDKQKTTKKGNGDISKLMGKPKLAGLEATPKRPEKTQLPRPKTGRKSLQKDFGKDLFT